MRKLGRWIISSLTLLCIATVCVWVRSYFANDEIGYVFPDQRSSRSVTAGWRMGYITFSRANFSYDNGLPPPAHRFSHGSFPPRDPYDTVTLRWLRFRFLGLGLAKISNPIVNLSFLIVPCWMIFTLTALPPALWLLRLIRRRRIPPGHCPHCGYNLRANLSGTCPECGQPTATAKM